MPGHEPAREYIHALIGHRSRISGVAGTMWPWSALSLAGRRWFAGPASTPVDGINPLHVLRLLHRLNVEVHDHRLAVAANQDAFQHLVRTGVDLLVRHEGRHVDEIAGPGLRGEFEPLAPAHACPALQHVNDALQRPVMMRTRLGVGMDVDCSRPELLSPHTGEGDGGLAVHARR